MSGEWLRTELLPWAIFAVVTLWVVLMGLPDEFYVWCVRRARERRARRRERARSHLENDN